MHAHLVPFPAGGGVAAPPADATATCLLHAADGSGWLLALTDAAEATFVVEHIDSHAEGAADSAAVVRFDGPRDAAQVAADRRAASERVGPAALQVPGNLGAIVLRAADGAMVTVAFADTPETLEASSRAVLSTPLLPGEDPALLGGPQSYTVCGVVGDGVAAVLRREAAGTPA